MKRAALLWLAALLITLASAVWQRLSGPTHPVRLRADLDGAPVAARLLRSHSTSGPQPVAVTAPDPAVTGDLVWRRHPTPDPWTRTPLARDGDRLTAWLPAQPAAGKLAYRIELRRGDDAPPAATLTLPAGGPVITRFKGDVPAAVLVPHIVLIFLAMLVSNRAGLSALAGFPDRRPQILGAAALLILGGLLFGPLVQKAAFDAYWTGWPFGHDLTDNKLAVSVLTWLVAVWRDPGKTARGRGWTILAAAVTLAIFLIPHSLLGSEFDHMAAEGGR